MGDISTKIKITEGFGQIEHLKLNIAELAVNTDYSKLAYCSKVEVMTREDGSPFFRFRLHDKGGHTITGRLFNVENVESKGITANNLSNTVVKIMFTLSKFSGTDSLTIKTIDPVAESTLSREEFIGELEGVDDAMRVIRNVESSVVSSYEIVGQLFTKYSEKLMSKIERVPIPELWAGRRGGAVLFSSRLLSMCDAAFPASERNRVRAIVLLSEVFMYWKYQCNYEENVLSLGDNINKILAQTDTYLDAVIKAASDKNRVEESNICKETKHLIKCYFGYDTPRTYITRAIWCIRNSLTESIVLCDYDTSMLNGTKRTVQIGDNKFEMVKL